MKLQSPAGLLAQMMSFPSRLVCGVMSGTSLDGIDVAFVRITGYGESTEVQPAAFEEIPFDDGIRSIIKKNSSPDTSSVDEICYLNALLGHVYADAIRSCAAKHSIDLPSVHLIGLHGQTIHHLPTAHERFGYSVRSTLQIGNGATLAALIGIPVISDFRSADMALDGQGAPLVPYVDWILFRSAERDRVLLNVGGIANITVLKRGCAQDDVVAFDTGPGNMVIDNLMQHYFHRAYDTDGEIALQGRVHDEMLSSLVQHEYFSRPIPKSTGREMFGEKYTRTIIRLAEEKFHLEPADIITTLTALTATSVAHSIRRCCVDEASGEIFVSGGGAKNRAVLNFLSRQFLSTQISPIESAGISGAAKEAICFAVLAHEWLHGCETNLPSVTGAKRRTVLGSLSIP